MVVCVKRKLVWQNQPSKIFKNPLPKSVGKMSLASTMTSTSTACFTSLDCLSGEFRSMIDDLLIGITTATPAPSSETTLASPAQKAVETCPF